MKKDYRNDNDIIALGVEGVKLHLIAERVAQIKSWRNNTKFTEDTRLEMITKQVEIIEFITEWSKSDNAKELWQDTIEKMWSIHDRDKN